MTGQTISHYQIGEKLGEGGMGVVYKAEDLRLLRTVALKFLAVQSDSMAEEFRQRFLREAQAAAMIDHPNICAVYDLEEADGKTFIVMAYVEGRALNHLIRNHPLPLRDAVNVAMQVGEGLRAAHGKGVVHRDIKSANILMSRDGVAKITDFGLAFLADRSRITRPGSVMGTINYMSPEQAAGKPLDRRSDIWSLGVVVYEMVTGRLPFIAPRPQSVLVQIVREEPEPLNRKVPEELTRILGKLLAKAPEMRYQHVDDVIVDLRGVYAQLPEETAIEPFQWARAATVTVTGSAEDATITLRTAMESVEQPEAPPAPIPIPDKQTGLYKVLVGLALLGGLAVMLWLYLR